MAKQGEQTAKLGVELTEYIKTSFPIDHGLSFYYDHGDRKHDPHSVAVIHGFCGDRCTNRTRIAEFDMMIANKTNEVLLLIEIEERDVAPKQLLGNVMAFLICDKCAVKDKHDRKGHNIFNITSNTTLLVGGVVPDKGNRGPKILEIIQPRIGKIASSGTGLRSRNVKCFFESRLQSATNKVMQHIKDRLR